MPAASTRLPPGPIVPGWTRLITALWPTRLEFDSLAYLLQNRAKFGRLFTITVGDQVTVVTSDPALMHEIFVTRASEFQKAPMLRSAVGALVGNGLLTSEGDFWKRQRKLAQPAFHARRVDSYGDVMVKSAAALAAQWRPGETRNIAHDMMAITLQIVCKTLFDVDVRADIERIGRVMHPLLESANDRLNSYNPVWERLFRTRGRIEDAALADLFAFVDGVIAERKREGRDHGDLLSMLIDARDDDGQPMSDKQLRDEVVTLLVAGHETTANLLTWAFYLLALHEAVYQRAVADVDALGDRLPVIDDLKQLGYLEQILKESMRLYPPAGGATRAPIRDIDLGGYHIPAGTSIGLTTYVMHRDPELFSDPLRFDPERFSAANEPAIPRYAYLPFGGGPRVCIGNTFALIEAQLVLATLLKRHRLTLPPGATVQAEQLFTIRPKGGLRMIVADRASA
jgi:cytochrome P450